MTTTNRIETTFAELKQRNRTGLITFFMANDPTPQDFRQLLASLPQAGVDIIEIGMPFSDPIADGTVIQASGIRSLQYNTSLQDVLKLVVDFRKQNSTTPIVLMGYINPILNFGYKSFFEQVAKAGVDALILVDIPPEEEQDIRKIAQANNLELVRLLTPTTGKERLQAITNNCSGFLYYVSVSGITGTKTATLSQTQQAIATIKSNSKLPVAIGFGIKDAQSARENGAIADAVVIGSALIEHNYEQYQKGKRGTELVQATNSKIQEIRQALDS